MRKERVFVRLMSLVALFLCSCYIGLDGRETIDKQEAENLIYREVLVKAVSCGMNERRAILVSGLGNSRNDHESGNDERIRKSIIYEMKALDYCLRSLRLMPCPVGRRDTFEQDQNFMAIVALTRQRSCTFHPIHLLDYEYPFQGRLY